MVRGVIFRIRVMTNKRTPAMIQNAPPYSPLLFRLFLRYLVAPPLAYLLLSQLLALLPCQPTYRTTTSLLCTLVIFYLANRLHHLRSVLLDTPTAIPIPVLPRRWPLNVDVLVEWMKEGRREYFGEGVVVKLSARFGMDERGKRRVQTFNTRLLGENSVSR